MELANTIIQSQQNKNMKLINRKIESQKNNNIEPKQCNNIKPPNATI